MSEHGTGPVAVLQRDGSDTTSDAPDGLLDEEPRRRISFLRVLIALVVLALAVGGGIIGLRTRLAATAVVPGTWFAPYVDVTATPTYQFQDSANNDARQVVLGFVVAQGRTSCTPSWGGAYTEDQAAQSLNLDSRVAQVRQEGAQVIASFGGQKNTNLDDACSDPAALRAAYQSVISRYHLTTVDLDMEGAALDDFAAVQRGATAMAALQRAARAAHSHLDVWLTLPVEPNGLQDNALSVVTTMLRAHVALAGVDVMTMDFDHVGSDPDMLAQSEQALDATHAQLADLFPRYGIDLRGKQVWNRMGATVMIGQNDVAGQQFTVADARGLARFATRNGLGRTSMWSLNRDSQCGSNFALTGVKSTSCSGVAQSRLAFSGVLAGQLKGTAGAQTTSAARLTSPAVDTNPADAPYPQWQPAESYQTGYKVVRQGYIYQSKWYNQGQDPASQVQYSWQTPWLLVGPVVKGDHAPTLPTLPAGTYPAWSETQSYVTGDRVLFNGLAYQAKWASLGASPASEQVDPSSSPWQALFTIPGEPTTDNGSTNS
ncbi:MAG TPA: carbohydrate-binding protein [Acidimicrobiales bacterium]